MPKSKGKKKEKAGKAATAPPTSDEGEPPSTSEGVGDTTTATTTGASTAPPSSALADLLGSDPNAPPEGKTGKGKKGKKGKKGSKKGKKGKKGKKKKKKDVPPPEPEDTGPKYTQKDIDDYIKKREREKKRRREDRLVNKIKELISIVRPEDIRWTTYTLAPLYQFIRRSEVEVVTAFFHRAETKKEEKKLLFADDANPDSDSLGKSKSKMADGKSVTSMTSQSTTKVEKSPGGFRKSKGWTRMSINRGTDGLSLIVINDVVPNNSPDLFYFIKLKQIILDKDNFFDNVVFGNVPGGHLTSLHSLLTYVYSPMFTVPGILPESIQNEFYASLTSLMTSMTETHHRLQNQTVLYVPKEAMAMPIDKASKDKDLCARLESAMVHWIRQIRNATATFSEDTEDWAGPLEEIAFWRARSSDLAGLTEQVQSKPVRTVKEIMTIMKSPFVANFNQATSEILQAYGEAVSNLYYLEILTDPCTMLHESTVAEIPGQIQNLLWLVRVIWLHSPYYNTRERLNNLFRKISNEIVSHCIKEIDIDLVFNGYIDTSEAGIKRCMDCVTLWKDKYFEAQKMHHMNSNTTWLLEYEQIFALVDGFLKRLKDLQEICTCQRLYARRVEGYQEPLPLYPGLKGPEMFRIMKEIQRIMDRQLRDLYGSHGQIFDVKSTAWNDAMTNFRGSIRDIEMMIQNVLFTTFDTVTTLSQGIQILETFYVYYARDIIRRTYDQLIMKLYKILEDDTAIVRNLYQSNVLPLPLAYPQYSGRAAWSNFMYARLNNQLEMLEKAWWLPECGYGEDVKDQAKVIKAQLQEHSSKMYKEWIKVVGNKDHTHRLDIPLMIRSTYKAGMIEVNFDKVLYRHIVEAEMWARIGQDIPQVLTYVYHQRDKLHNLRETVLLVVKDYNRIIGALSFEERSLFKERIKLLGRKVYPGLTRLTWASNVSDTYINDCRLAATKVQGFTANYKNANIKIGKLATKISNILMIKVDQKRLHERGEFNELQEQHRVKTVLKIANEYKNITVILRSVFEMFRSDGSEVKTQWIKYLKKIDEVVEEAFCLNIQRSLEILVRVVHGDVRGPPPPIFRLIATLHRYQLTFIPTVNELEDMISGIFRRICITVQPFPRVIQFLNDPSTKVLSFSQVMLRNEVAKGKQESIASGMKNILSEVEKYLQSWTQFREVWETDKDLFMAHYDDNAPSVKAYDNDIGRYWEIADAVQGFESTVSVGICIIDCGDLKQTVIDHCHDWQNRILTNLYEKAAEKLHSIYKYMEDNKASFRKEPTTLPDLINAYNLFRNVQMDAPRIEKEFPRMHEQFGILSKYKYDLGDWTRKRYTTFAVEWHAYQQALKDIEYMLKQSKEKLRKLFLAMAENFKQKVHDLVQALDKDGPYAGNINSKAALHQLHGYRRRMTLLSKDQQDLLASLAIFEIEMAPNQELRNFEGDLANVESVWHVVDEWEGYWNEYKSVPFKSMQTGDMEDVAGMMIKKFYKLATQFEKKNWQIIDQTKYRIEVFKKSIPVIHEIKTPALRERHWNMIFDTIGAKFDPEDERFTFDRIVSYKMEKFADEIADIANTAQKELLIEKTVISIREYWTDEKLEMIPYKDKGHYKLKTVQDMMQNLEDHNVSISAMKGSRFAKPFEQEITYWEKTLSTVNDVFDIFLNVQRQWMYLENIFLGEDIRRQLPDESKEFDTINQVWKNITEKMHEDQFVIQATHREGLIPVLKELSDRLELILKSLEIFLEAKRQAFPRFYFISNDDLLEILGNSRNPENVQQHLKKLFDNIHKIKLTKAPYGSKQEVHGMLSGDGEYIEFLKVFPIDGPVEHWLGEVEANMRSCLKVQLKKTRDDLRKNLNRRDKWIQEWPGQPGITAAQIQWTVAVTRALFAAGDPRIQKNPLKKVRKKLNKILTKFSMAIRGTLTKIARLKITAMVTIEIHARDVTDKLYKTGCQDLNSFDWLQQLRLYWDREENDCIVRQTNTFFNYGYEYLGNSGRLVITPLTDRCYVTLTTAMFLHRGGSPKGPAGTGKTETTKDLGKNLGMFVIVVNCSEGLDYKSMGKMFSGLSQTGAWGCFDEFNRINIEVLSVVAQQIMCILQAKSQNLRRFLFEGYDIQLVWSCGVFITMNPGYAGRTELPDNLKAMFRPISMIVPDTSLIAEIVLFGEGFDDTRTLARKVDTLYNLSKQQLSKQDHYDFGLRSMVALLRYAGQKRRVSPHMSDPEVLILAMRDMNIPRLTSDDVPLFNGVIRDLFPNDEPPKFDYGILLTTITNEFTKAGWQPTEKAILKCLELYETKNSRHSTMLVGRTQSGKSITWKCLRDSMTTLAEMGEPGYVRAKEYVINPKALSQAELYGEFDLSTGEWSDGVISSIMRITCADEKPDQKWILFDGPVDAVWIENMNSVMDDNKILTLINSERISMPEQVSLLFEVGDLTQASPATVSRCGMVYTDFRDLGWKPYLETWLGRFKKKKISEEYRKNIDFYLDVTLKFKEAVCKELIPTTELNVVTSLTRLMDSLATKENGVNPKDDNTFDIMVRFFFVFSLIWSVCCTTDEDGRKKFDAFLRELDPIFPAKDTIYDYFVDPLQRNFIHWNTLLSQQWKYDEELPYFKITVPTVDTIRYNFVLENLLKNSFPVLMVGPVGTGKTSVVTSALTALDQEKYSVLTINISSQTTSMNIQNFIESRLERRAKGVFAPPRGKFLLTFCDDLNMPAKDIYGSQPPLELIRQWCDYRFWYDRSTQTSKFITNMFLVGAMGPPGGGRTEISPRLQSVFSLINMTFPEEPQIKRIFLTMLNQNLVDFEQEVKSIAEPVTNATIDVYNSVSSKMLPTPSKIHYLFNLRDISRVYQGLLRAHKKVHDTKINFSKLWFHECCRVFNDRLVDDNDREWFLICLSEKLGTHLDQTLQSVCPNRIMPIFGDFLSEQGIYEDIKDIKALRKYMENVALPAYNASPGCVPMNLVLFREALEHVSRISRVISQPKGNMLIVGIGGHGRQSLSRLSSSICGYYIFEIEVNKRYKKADFREDLKKVYRRTGADNKTCCFIMNDTQIVDESFLEDLNNVLSSGEVPNLYKPDEFEDIKNTVMKAALRAGYQETNESIFKFLINRVQVNLHVVLCMSPIGDSFRHRVRQYPSLVNGTTIDWFDRWPKEALLEVAHRWLSDVNLDDRSNVLQDEMRDKCATTFATVHFSVTDYCRIMLEEMKRHNYVTPINFLELVAGYKQLLAEKRKFFGDSANRLRGGMAKIIETRVKVQDMTVEMESAQRRVIEYQEECDRVLEEITTQKAATDVQAEIVSKRKEQVAVEEKECQEMARVAYAELADALPALDEANKAG
ncbi:unnamed protein product [Orchesella dallaii]|uniref:AAA+ ATPase domain-containing protein n=1 Tax=Orchesella dallaii TaxID=48710 RepID=A0ABP1RBQ2_9HEXA